MESYSSDQYSTPGIYYVNQKFNDGKVNQSSCKEEDQLDMRESRYFNLVDDAHKGTRLDQELSQTEKSFSIDKEMARESKTYANDYDGKIDSFQISQCFEASL